MSDINWEPQNVANLAEQLSRIANEYREIISDIYINYNRIGQNELWTGINYNTIANDMFNVSRTTFSEWADYMQFTIPEQIYQIAQSQSSNGVIEFSIYEASADIRAIENSEEKSDGSFKLRMNEVQNIISNDLMELCDEANNKLQAYINQFEELKSIDGNAAIYLIYDKLEGIIDTNKSILKSFIRETSDAVEKTFNNIKYTEEETIRMAERITDMINNQ